MAQRPQPPPLRIHVDAAAVDDAEHVFTRSFTIGRGEECDVQVRRPKVSRLHARMVYEDAAWWVVDAESANGTYLNGQRIQRAQLGDKETVRLGHDGPVLHVQVQAQEEAPATWLQDVPPDAMTKISTGQRRKPPEPVPDRPSRSGTGSPGPEPSLTHYMEHYFGASDEEAGERTRMIRQAYQVVQKKQQQRWVWIGAAVAILVVVVSGYAVWQQIRANKLEQQLADAYQGVQELEAGILQLRHYIAARGDASLEEQLEGLQAQRERQVALLEGYIEELGYRRRLTDEERVIHKVARVFNESEFVIPSAFVRRVREELQTYWLTPAGRHRYERNIRRAEEEGYTELIAQTMMKYNLPPEFFYLALVESDFNARAVGPQTAYGYAKGMWQFIPETGAAYGLEIGPRQDDPIYDSGDERHDPAAATDAAARYLLEIHSQLAGASGLLAMASYNWGEGRVVWRMERLFEGLADDVVQRTYWRFYTEYEDRMPLETKNYVARIFSAAVIGEDPRLFGFDFDNPLEPYLTAPGDQPQSLADHAVSEAE